jgi:lysophospholipase L1-like esterase
MLLSDNSLKAELEPVIKQIKGGCLALFLWLIAGGSTAAAGAAPAQAESNDEAEGTKEDPLRIMCLGDSITVGYTDNPIWKVPFKFGYRSRLYKLLKSAGYHFTFVGDSPQPWDKTSGDPTHGGSYKPKFDLRDLGQDHHQGGRGAPIPALKGWVSGSDPDLILLMIGINGISKESPARIRGLVETIVTDKPDAHLIVAQITPYVDTQVDKNKLLYEYNVSIRDTLVPEFAEKGHQISTVDMYSLFLIDPDDYESGVAPGKHSNNYNHPFNEEYDLMADRWFAAIEALQLKRR